MMRAIRVTLLLCCIMGLSALLPREPASAQSSKAVAYLLKEITARITLHTPAGHGGLCHGFVYTVRGEMAYVATAKHCLADLVVPPLDRVPSLDLTATVQYANGTAGTVQHFVWTKNQDALVAIASFTTHPRAYLEVCVDCWSYETFGLGKNVPVVSVLSAGGGPPVISSGVVSSGLTGGYVVYLPSSSGSSGAPILDLRGNLVGLISAGSLSRGAEAGWKTRIVPGAEVESLLRHALEQYARRAGLGTRGADTP